jgi:hypothetical protein
VNVLFQAIIRNEDLSEEETMMYVYGLYLMHGGSPEKFDDLTMTDIQLMYVAYLGEQKRNSKEVARRIGKVLLQIFGADKED